jgi:hypothetical protein
VGTKAERGGVRIHIVIVNMVLLINKVGYSNMKKTSPTLFKNMIKHRHYIIIIAALVTTALIATNTTTPTLTLL